MTMNIPFLDLGPINKHVRERMYQAFSDVFESNWYILGKRVEIFEKGYSTLNSVAHTIGVANGLDAIYLSLKVLGIGKGDEVIVPSNTYIASWIGVTLTGATPVIVEPNRDTYNIDPKKISEKISPRVKAIMPVHLYGQACEMGPIMEIAATNKLSVVEDNAQAHGAYYKNEMTGSIGTINITSFYPGKNLGAYGDAGAITTNSEDLAHQARVLRNYGSQVKYYNDVIGHNSRLDEMQAAFLSIKLEFLNNWSIERQAIAAKYNALLKDVPEITLPVVASGCTHVYHLFVIRSSKRNELQQFLHENGIGTLIHYPLPPHLQKAYSSLNCKSGDYPIAEEIANTCLSLPLYVGMQDAQIEYVSEIIKKFFKK